MSLTPGTAREGQASKVGAIIVAAGDSRRMLGLDKIFAPVSERPLISYSVQVFNDSHLVGKIVLVVSSDNVERARRLAEESGWRKVQEVCAGAESRQGSVRQGLDRMQDTDWTIVHDGARPCLHSDDISKGLEEAKATGAASAAIPVRDTLKSAGPDQTVRETLDRDGLWAAQTPQVFRTEILTEAHSQVSEVATDDAMLVERMGRPVKMFMGSYDNIKVTMPEDILIAEAILKGRTTREHRRSR